jgi:catechol 2,3-dioxygenase-like lactoylglutathione lyase family enzyme
MTDMRLTLIFYVADVAKSCTFYTRILEREPVEASPNFAMYALKSGTMFGLWARHDVRPVWRASRQLDEEPLSPATMKNNVTVPTCVHLSDSSRLVVSEDQ